MIVSGSTVRGSILCPNVRVHSYCDIDRSILMPGVRVGRHARIRNAIIDRDVFIPRGAVIGHNHEEDRKRHTVTARARGGHHRRRTVSSRRRESTPSKHEQEPARRLIAESEKISQLPRWRGRAALGLAARVRSPGCVAERARSTLRRKPSAFIIQEHVQ